MSTQDAKTRREQKKELNEFVVIFLVVYIIIHFVPSKEDVEMFRAWFIMFCIVRLMFEFILILPQRDKTGGSNALGP